MIDAYIDGHAFPAKATRTTDAVDIVLTIAVTFVSLSDALCLLGAEVRKTYAGRS